MNALIYQGDQTSRKEALKDIDNCNNTIKAQILKLNLNVEATKPAP